ncbi:MAG TPA: hypothetical protein VGE11_02590, partial [Pseudonocardia sp.]
PAFAAVLLGATSVRPGRVNVWGTVIAVLLLAVAVAGLQEFGLPFFVEYILNGAIVIVAVAAAGFASRRRTGQMRRQRAEHSFTSLAIEDATPDAAGLETIRNS